MKKKNIKVIEVTTMYECQTCGNQWTEKQEEDELNK